MRNITTLAISCLDACHIPYHKLVIEPVPSEVLAAYRVIFHTGLLTDADTTRLIRLLEKTAIQEYQEQMYFFIDTTFETPAEAILCQL